MIAVDVKHEKIYWAGISEGWPAIIYESDLDGKNTEIMAKVIGNFTFLFNLR